MRGINLQKRERKETVRVEPGLLLPSYSTEIGKSREGAQSYLK